MVSLEQGRIGDWQFILLMMGFIFGSSIILVPGNQAGHDAWIAIILGMLGGIIVALVYTFLCIRFKGKNLIQIHEIVYGPYLGKLMSLLFLWFIFHMGSLITNVFTYFFSITTFPRTPDVFLMVLIVFVCAYAAQNGIEVIARCGFIIVLASMVIFLGSSIFLINNFHVSNFFPLFEAPIKEMLTAAYGAAAFPFAETVVFAMIIPYLNRKHGSIFPVVTALLLGGLFITLISIRNIGALGPLNGIYVYPTFQTDRMIDVGGFIRRMEIITVSVFLTFGFLKISVILYATALGSAELLGLRTYRPLVPPIGILMVIVALQNFKTFTGGISFSQQIYPIYALPFELGVPLLTLIVALIRKLPKK
jgi:spore germination protein KB